ncbi:hypothetical protein ACJIZ3_001342 [Penstemon smallii]|uniref:Sm domain-containing protein n=1 Tax=Penstemon smallii TaxID=265156 RepID=A0ABD3U3A6_9LAMI
MYDPPLHTNTIAFSSGRSPVPKENQKKMLPLSLLKTAQGHPMLVELKNGETYNGHLVNCDTWMNIHLREVICTSKDGDRFWRMPECYIRGNTIKYLRVPDENKYPRRRILPYDYSLVFAHTQLLCELVIHHSVDRSLIKFRKKQRVVQIENLLELDAEEEEVEMTVPLEDSQKEWGVVVWMMLEAVERGLLAANLLAENIRTYAMVDVFSGIQTPSPRLFRKFHFNSPYITTSPQRFFYSAPTSPARASAFYKDFHGGGVPFDWEEKPGIAKTKESTTATSSNYGDAEQEDLEEIDFAFDFSGHLETSSLPADELFHGGQIKPLKPPPRFHYDQNNKSFDSPKSPRSPTKLIKEAFSPRHRRNNFDPFAIALEQTRKESIQENENTNNRGRERNVNSRSKVARSLSPYKVSDLLFDPKPTQKEATKNTSDSNNSSFSSSSFSSICASESRATDNDEINKYSILKDELKNSSFRSTDNNSRKSGIPISAHEMHYTVNRAVSEEMKKRTFLPYKQGVLGCLGFRSTGPQISKGFGSSGSMSRGSK